MSTVVTAGGNAQVVAGSRDVVQVGLETVEPSTRFTNMDFYVYFERPESFRGKLRVPANFEELDADLQNDIIERAMEQKRGVWIDYWDYEH